MLIRMRVCNPSGPWCCKFSPLHRLFLQENRHTRKPVEFPEKASFGMLAIGGSQHSLLKLPRPISPLVLQKSTLIYRTKDKGTYLENHCWNSQHQRENSSHCQSPPQTRDTISTPIFYWKREKRENLKWILDPNVKM